MPDPGNPVPIRVIRVWRLVIGGVLLILIGKGSDERRTFGDQAPADRLLSRHPGISIHRIVLTVADVVPGATDAVPTVTDVASGVTDADLLTTEGDPPFTDGVS